MEEQEYCENETDQVYGSTSGEEDFQDEEGDETPLQSPCVPVFGCSELSLEEEPRQIRQLLNQTGSELVVGSPQDCLSMSFFERLAREQIQHESAGDETSPGQENLRL